MATPLWPLIRCSRTLVPGVAAPRPPLPPSRLLARQQRTTTAQLAVLVLRPRLRNPPGMAQQRARAPSRPHPPRAPPWILTSPARPPPSCPAMPLVALPPLPRHGPSLSPPCMARPVVARAPPPHPRAPPWTPLAPLARSLPPAQRCCCWRARRCQPRCQSCQPRCQRCHHCILHGWHACPGLCPAAPHHGLQRPGHPPWRVPCPLAARPTPSASAPPMPFPIASPVTSASPALVYSAVPSAVADLCILNMWPPSSYSSFLSLSHTSKGVLTKTH